METINTGAKLLFNLSQKPNTRWGSKTSDMPPSFKGTHDPI
jgi:putative alpha-1,2-mannosidase